MNQRLTEARNSLASFSLDACLITNEINVSYLSGFSGDSSYLLVGASDAVILSDRRYETQIQEECPDFEAAIRPPTQSMEQLVGQVLAPSRHLRIGFESDHVSVSTLHRWRQELADRDVQLEFVETAGVIESLRSIKDEQEIRTIRKSVQIAERAFLSIVPHLTPQTTEREVAFELESVMRRLGANGVSFHPIVGAEPSGALPHYRPADQPLGQTPSLLIDWGADYQGYASDLTRTLCQDSASQKYRECYALVLEAQLAAIDRIRDGVLASEVDFAARQVLEKVGLGDAFKHGLGHGIGLQIHEAPRMASVCEEPLRAGMVVTVEPGVYFEGEFGIRIEDDVLVTESGCEVLSRLGKGLDDSSLIL